MSAPGLNTQLLARVAAVQHLGAPRIARRLGIPLSTAGLYLARVRGRAPRRKPRYVVMVYDRTLDEDEQHGGFADRASAEAEAQRLNTRFVRWGYGVPKWERPLAYVVDLRGCDVEVAS